MASINKTFRAAYYNKLSLSSTNSQTMWNQNKYSNISKLQSKVKIFPQPYFIANEINKYFSDVPADLVNVMGWLNSGNFHT